MTIRYQVSLAHEGCSHAGSVVWEERDRADPRQGQSPVVVSLPRGFVSVTSDDGTVEILCTRCAQTIASASFPPSPAEEVALVASPEPDTVVETGRVAGPGDPAMAGDLELLFSEHPDVPPIPGDTIPHHLVDRLRHLAGRLRSGPR